VADELCSRCKENRRVQSHRWCRACLNAYARLHRPRYRDLSEEERKRAICRSYTRELVLRGIIQKQPCACGSSDVQAHHHDYNNPRLVYWMCRDCHRRLHNEERSVSGPIGPADLLVKHAPAEVRPVRQRVDADDGDEEPGDGRPCSRCRTRRATDGQSWCRRCFTEYARSRLVPYRDLTEREKIMSRCRANTYQLVKRGKLVSGPCERCGKTPVVAHHDDHFKPQEVRWLCRRHAAELRRRGPMAEQPTTLADVLTKHLGRLEP